jgi:transposase
LIIRVSNKKGVVQMNKSEMFRQMYDEGKSIAEISKETQSVYSYVYGVIDRYLTSKGEEIRKTDRSNSKSSQIRELYNNGMEIGDICREMMKEGIYVNYSYVWSVVNKLRAKENK